MAIYLDKRSPHSTCDLIIKNIPGVFRKRNWYLVMIVCFLVAGAKEWNELPVCIQEVGKLNIFEKRLNVKVLSVRTNCQIIVTMIFEKIVFRYLYV